MIKKNIGYIIASIILLISAVIIYQKYSYFKKIEHDTSSSKTVRKDSEVVKETQTKSSKTKYIIKKGDTLWDLSVKYYGDGTKYKEIIKNNPGKTFKFKNGNEGLIYPGTELEI